VSVPKFVTAPAPVPRAVSPDVLRAWRVAGRFAFVLFLAGLSDWIIAWIPFRLGSLEWEFGTITATLAGLPLVAIGLGGMLASGIAVGSRWQTIAVAVTILVFALLILAALAIFVLDVPVALQSVEGVARLGIQKAIAKNLSLGLLFFVAFMIAAFAGLRHAASRRPR
jgi:hypothetical protein